MAASSTPFQMTSEELFGLSAALDLPAPGFLKSDATRSWTDEIRQEVERLGIRSLAARDLIRFEADRALIPQTIADLAQTLCQPGLLARLWTSHHEEHHLVDFHATNSWAAGRRVTSVGNHAFTLFAAERLMEVIFAAADLPEDAHPGKREATLARSVIDRFLEATTSSNPPDREDGSPDDDILRALAATGSRTGMLMVVYPDASGTLAGSSVTWALTSDNELYEVSRSDEEDPVSTDVLLTPRTRQDMSRLFRTSLPA